MSSDPGTTPEATDDVAEEPKGGVAARQVAASIVVQVHADQAWASPVADRVLRHADLSAQDRSFATNLAFSTLRWEGTLDWILGHAVSRGLEAVEPTLLDILRIGTWELRYGGQPTHAVVDSHVEVARSLVGQRATGFVNGVLRTVARTADDLPWPDPATPEGMALHHGYPTWVAQAALDRFGPDRAPDVLAAGNVPAPLVLRAVAPRQSVLDRLAADGIAARPGALSPDAVVLEDRHVPGRLAVITEGLAIVQDQASQLVGRIAAEGLPEGASAVDLCAAPGGKATHLAQQGLVVTAVDRHAGRIRRTAESASRLGLALTTLAADGAASGLPPGEADLVLLDAPCSGLGVVRRRPELRWRRGPEDVTALAALQRRLLRAAVDLVRPGGRVVYSVCTWTTEEADDVVADAVSAGRVQVKAPPSVGTPTRFGTQMAPDVVEGDGMYVAVMERTEHAT